MSWFVLGRNQCCSFATVFIRKCFFFIFNVFIASCHSQLENYLSFFPTKFSGQLKVTIFIVLPRCASFEDKIEMMDLFARRTGGQIASLSFASPFLHMWQGYYGRLYFQQPMGNLSTMVGVQKPLENVLYCLHRKPMRNCLFS